MPGQAAALKQPAQDDETMVTAIDLAEDAAAVEAQAEKVVGLHGAFVAPDPAGPNIDLFDNVPV